MHPGASKRKHVSRASASVNLVATSQGLEEVAAPAPAPPDGHPSAVSARLNPVRNAPAAAAHRRDPKTGRTVGTRIGDPPLGAVPSSVGATGSRTASARGDADPQSSQHQIAQPVAIPRRDVVNQAVVPQQPHVDPNRSEPPTGPPAPAVGRSGAAVPSSVTTLPLIEPRRGGRRLHTHTDAEAWINGIVARYGGIDPVAPDGELDHAAAAAVAGNLVPVDSAALVPQGDGPTLAIEGPPGTGSGDDATSSVAELTSGVVPAPNSIDPVRATAYTTVHAAQTRKQLYALCQQLILDASRHGRRNTAVSMPDAAAESMYSRGGQPLIEVEVRERGHRVWHSAGCAEADLDEVDVAVEAVDEDIQAVRKRAQRAFRKTVAVYKDKLTQVRAEADRFKAEAASKDLGGSAFRTLQNEVETLKATNRQLNAKIKALMKLLERAGATIKHQEEQHEQEQALAATGGAASAIDWESARAVMPELIVEDREGPGIVRDIVDHVEKLNVRLAEVEASNEVFSEKFAERDAQADMLRRERDALSVKLRLHEATMSSLRAEANAAQGETDAVRKELDDTRKAAEAERDRLILANMEAEKAIRKTVESKPFFLAHGRGLSIPVFLRYDGKVRNLDLPKKEVEDLINLVWAARDTHNAVKRAQRAIEHREKQARSAESGQQPPQPDASASEGNAGLVVNLGSGNSVDQLIDYDNIRFVKRLPGRFAEHVAVFLIEHFGNGAAGDDDGDGDMGISARKGKGKGGKGKEERPQFKVPTREQMRKYGFMMPSGVVEYAYSLMEGCEKFKYDADIELFRRVARGEISEQAYFDQMIMLVKLKVMLQSAARTLGSTNSLTINVVIDVVKKFFPTKPQESVEMLYKSLVMEIPDGQNMSEIALQSIRLSISKLFASNEHGNQGPFMEAVRDQHLEEVCTYVFEVSDCISACSNAPEGKGKLVPLYVVRRRLHEMDPLKPMEDINRFLLNALAAYNDEGDDDDTDAPKSNAIHLNSEIDCERLAQASKRVFAKRFSIVAEDPHAAADGPRSSAPNSRPTTTEGSGVAPPTDDAIGADIDPAPLSGAAPVSDEFGAPVATMQSTVEVASASVLGPAGSLDLSATAPELAGTRAPNAAEIVLSPTDSGGTPASIDTPRTITTPRGTTPSTRARGTKKKGP